MAIEAKWGSRNIQKGPVFRALRIVWATFMLPWDYPGQEMRFLNLCWIKNCEVYGMFPSNIHGSGVFNKRIEKFIRARTTNMQGRDMYLAHIEKNGKIKINLEGLGPSGSLFSTGRFSTMFFLHLDSSDGFVTMPNLLMVFMPMAQPKITPKSSSSAWARMSRQVVALLLVCPISP